VQPEKLWDLAKPVSKKDNVRQLNVAVDLNMNDDWDIKADDWLLRHRNLPKKKNTPDEEQKPDSK